MLDETFLTWDCLTAGTWNFGDTGLGGGVPSSEDVDDEEMYRGIAGRAVFNIGDCGLTAPFIGCFCKF